MSRRLALDGLRRIRFPRVSGDEPAGRRVWTVSVKFSPRERG